MSFIKNIVMVILSLSLIVGCTSNPVTVLEKRTGTIMREKIVYISESNSIATLGGAIAGGVLGNQLGGGTGKSIATVGGALIGGSGGHSMSKKRVEHYEYLVTMHDGEKFILETKESRKKIGSKVVVERLSTGRERIFVL
ncbi:glycine zipper 2TM domain-containing protein [Vibrio sp. 1F255]|uniref:glycine zipper 2TM domain-containing protein n=1 Tax=Vibrio sp. 1F255 TaxID=3230009 RepID=UPI00352F5083